MFLNRASAQDVFAEHSFDNGIAKDFQFGEYDRKPLDMVNYDKDPGAHALVLKEFGKAWITSNGSTASLMFEYHVRIKLFDNEALKRGRIELPYYIQDNGRYEEIRTNSIQASTYYKDTNGAMKASNIDPDSINIVKVNKHLSKVVFIMPHLQSGCIIEYKYKLESPFLENFKTWEFQSDIPKIYSEYEVHIPKVFGYNVSLRGALKLTKDTTAIEKECFEATNMKSDCTIEDYEITNIPAFKEEPYMPSPKNYISALYFQLTEYESINNFSNLNQAWHLNIASDWTDVDKLLKYSDNFGGQLNHRSFFKDHIPAIVAGKTDSLNRAKAIYSYIQKAIIFNGINSIYSDEGIKKALDKHAGNVADVNLSLVAALNEAGLNAGAVLISTYDNGTVSKLYPGLGEFNYVIAAVNLGGRDYLLDATEPQLQFGVLPLKCLNGQGRAIPLNKPSYWINIVTPQTRTDVYNVALKLSDNGKLTGTITHHSKSYEAFDKRKLIKGFKTIEDYVHSINLSPGMHIVRSTISNLDSLDMPLTETYEVEGNVNGEVFDAFIIDKLTDNPFKSSTRTYDINMGMPALNSYVLTLQLPANKTVIPPAKPAGDLSTSFDINGNTATYTQQYQLRPTYTVAEYSDLKTLIDNIILSEKTQLKLTNK